jgi:hypothetical protein
MEGDEPEQPDIVELLLTLEILLSLWRARRAREADTGGVRAPPVETKDVE